MTTPNYNHPTASALNELFRSFAPTQTSSPWRWIEKDAAWQGQVDLPGFPKEEVTVFVDKDRVLSVEAKQPEPKEGETVAFPRRDVSYKLRLPREVDAEKLSASLDNGVLAIDLPKVTPDSQIERRIELN